MNTKVLADTKIGTTVSQLRRRVPSVTEQAQELMPRWERIFKMETKKKERLSLYRQRKQHWEAKGRAKPDMIAYKELPKVPRVHGDIEAVFVGMKLASRGEAAALGIHCSMLSGIDSLKGDACYAVCASGGYSSNEYAENGSFWYTGAGGQKGRRQVHDQDENADNQSLLLSVRGGTPVHVLRGFDMGRNRKMYHYEGLFKCTKYEYVPSTDGPMVYRFLLVPIPGKVVLLEKRRRDNR